MFSFYVFIQWKTITTAEPAFCLMCANVQSNVEKQIPQAAN